MGGPHPNGDADALRIIAGCAVHSGELGTRRSATINRIAWPTAISAPAAATMPRTTIANQSLPNPKYSFHCDPHASGRL